ncbi:hypothetical protein G6F57_017185 [Rhizopus arrhizus]|nr:hypothetical protein G6F57_017185 [Rhizopus arrhizus]
MFVGERMQGGAAVDHAVVLQHREILHVAFDHAARARHQGAVGFQRFDQAQDGAHVVDRGGAQIVQRVFHHHGAHAVVGEDLEQHAAVQRERQQVGAGHAAFDRQRRVLQEGVGFFVQFAAGQQRVGVHAGQFGVQRTVVVQHALRGGQEDQLLGAQRHGDAGGQVFHGQVERVARGREAQRRQQHHRRALLDGELQCLGVDLAHLAGVLVVHPVQHAGGTRRHEIA